MQKIHPDKAKGFEEQFKELKEARSWIKSGIPLPQPTHTAGTLSKVPLTYLK